MQHLQTSKEKSCIDIYNREGLILGIIRGDQDERINKGGLIHQRERIKGAKRRLLINLLC